MSPPLTVEVIRRPAVESTHRVHAIILDGKGEIRAAHGDIGRPTFPRSTIKPLQVLPLVESGAEISDEELALACASHGGEDIHLRLAAQWLARLGLDEGALECGPHAPYHDPRKPATPLANNCSGKHAGMLAFALHLAAPVKGYTDPGHPVQQKILGTLSNFCGLTLTPHTCGIDGCSAPNPVIPLEAIARGFANFMTAGTPATRRVMEAMIRHPLLVGGTDRIDSVLMQASSGKVIAKAGAEGVQIAMIPAADAVIALKAEDGAGRAVQAAFCYLLEKHGLADSAVLSILRPHALPELRNWRSLNTGEIRVLEP